MATAQRHRTTRPNTKPVTDLKRVIEDIATVERSTRVVRRESGDAFRERRKTAAPPSPARRRLEPQREKSGCPAIRFFWDGLLAEALVLSKLFDLDMDTAKKWLADAAGPAAAATGRLFNGDDAPYSSVVESARDSEQLPAVVQDSQFEVRDAVDTYGYHISERSAFYGVVLGWRLHELITKGGAQ
jgi:hypothetical protein